ncbi:hypothetical protein GHT06_022364 [Daphnia sinensis]|uniref:Uncharacterized protein n=1 Tax=Daphnia sinensis TaxID=1820382 RepID=A0AAD5KXR1_9CRUS|nr:hypothetical protein GHT06_022364 [Daphnia sinensis]
MYIYMICVVVPLKPGIITENLRRDLMTINIARAHNKITWSLSPSVGRIHDSPVIPSPWSYEQGPYYIVKTQLTKTSDILSGNCPKLLVVALTARKSSAFVLAHAQKKKKKQFVNRDFDRLVGY